MGSEDVERVRIECFSETAEQKASTELEVGIKQGYSFRMEEIWVCLLARGKRLEEASGLKGWKKIMVLMKLRESNVEQDSTLLCFSV